MEDKKNKSEKKEIKKSPKEMYLEQSIGDYYSTDFGDDIDAEMEAYAIAQIMKDQKLHKDYFKGVMSHI